MFKLKTAILVIFGCFARRFMLNKREKLIKCFEQLKIQNIERIVQNFKAT